MGLLGGGGSMYHISYAMRLVFLARIRPLSLCATVVTAIDMEALAKVLILQNCAHNKNECKRETAYGNKRREKTSRMNDGR